MNRATGTRTGGMILVMSLSALLSDWLLKASNIIEWVNVQAYAEFIFFVSALTVGALSVYVFLWLYDKILWGNLFYRNHYLGGVWHYTNTYPGHSNRDITSGYIVIKHTPFELSYVDSANDSASNDKNGYKSRTQSAAAKYYPSKQTLTFAYNVTRLGEEKWNIDKRSIEELKVTKHSSISGKPVEMLGGFWNCVGGENESSSRKSKSSKLDWSPVAGQSMYVRSSKKKMNEDMKSEQE